MTNFVRCDSQINRVQTPNQNEPRFLLHCYMLAEEEFLDLYHIATLAYQLQLFYTIWISSEIPHHRGYGYMMIR